MRCGCCYIFLLLLLFFGVSLNIRHIFGWWIVVACVRREWKWDWRSFTRIANFRFTSTVSFFFYGSNDYVKWHHGIQLKCMECKSSTRTILYVDFALCRSSKWLKHINTFTETFHQSTQTQTKYRRWWCSDANNNKVDGQSNKNIIWNGINLHVIGSEDIVLLWLNLRYYHEILRHFVRTHHTFFFGTIFGVNSRDHKLCFSLQLMARQKKNQITCDSRHGEESLGPRRNNGIKSEVIFQNTEPHCLIFTWFEWLSYKLSIITHFILKSAENSNFRDEPNSNFSAFESKLGKVWLLVY